MDIYVIQQILITFLKKLSQKWNDCVWVNVWVEMAVWSRIDSVTYCVICCNSSASGSFQLLNVVCPLRTAVDGGSPLPPGSWPSSVNHQLNLIQLKTSLDNSFLSKSTWEIIFDVFLIPSKIICNYAIRYRLL